MPSTSGSHAYYIFAENTTPYYREKAMSTPADQVRNRLQDALAVLHYALRLAGTSGPIADPLAVRTQLELGGHHLERAIALLARP
jgi:hypothetical protein